MVISVTYDVIFEAWDSSPDVLMSENQTGTSFSPGPLTANTTYYWQINPSGYLLLEQRRLSLELHHGQRQRGPRRDDPHPRRQLPDGLRPGSQRRVFLPFG